MASCDRAWVGSVQGAYHAVLVHVGFHSVVSGREYAAYAGSEGNAWLFRTCQLVAKKVTAAAVFAHSGSGGMATNRSHASVASVVRGQEPFCPCRHRSFLRKN